MVRALIALGHELRLSLVAEGVETPAQAAALRVIGCEFAQGYHLGSSGSPRPGLGGARGIVGLRVGRLAIRAHHPVSPLFARPLTFSQVRGGYRVRQEIVNRDDAEVVATP